MIILRIRELCFFFKYNCEVVRVFQIREHDAKIVKLGRYVKAAPNFQVQSLVSIIKFSILKRERKNQKKVGEPLPYFKLQ